MQFASIFDLFLEQDIVDGKHLVLRNSICFHFNIFPFPLFLPLPIGIDNEQLRPSILLSFEKAQFPSMK